VLETQRVDARPHFRRHVDQLEISLLIATDLGALNEHAQDREIDPIPRAAIDYELAPATRQRGDDFSAQATTIGTVKILRESNPIRKAILLGSWGKHHGLLCLGMTQRRAES
jgi:hypothetical protein